MQQQDLLNLAEQTQEIPPTLKTQITVKPSGEISVTGNPGEEILKQLIKSSDYHKEQIRVSEDYHQSQQRRLEETIKNRQSSIDLLVVGFLGSTFLVVIVCFFLTLSKSNQISEVHSNGESFRRISCQQIQ